MAISKDRANDIVDSLLQNIDKAIADKVEVSKDGYGVRITIPYRVDNEDSPYDGESGDFSFWLDIYPSNEKDELGVPYYESDWNKYIFNLSDWTEYGTTDWIDKLFQERVGEDYTYLTELAQDAIYDETGEVISFL